jgi:ankyrin repeat protein
MRVHSMAILVTGLVVSAYGQGPAGLPQLLERLRSGDSRSVEALLRSGANPNTRDASGATALMYAAAFAQQAAIDALLRAGADVNAANQVGATALMWATHDSARVRLLLDRGANVNAARPDGMTALLGAALRGNRQVVEMLVAAGADARKGSAAAPWPLTLTQIALTTNDPAMRAFVDPSETTAQRLALWTPSPLTRWLVTTVNSWRPQPASTGAAVAKALLDAGANANEVISQQTLPVPALSRVAQLGDVETMRLLLDRGADPNLKGARGLTALMMAAATTPDAGMVRLLLERGASSGTRDDNGHTALDWALRLGETDASRELRKAGAQAMADAVTPPKSVSRPRPARDAVELALARLQPAGPAFAGRTRCISCHHQSLPAVAVTRAAARGARIDRTLTSHPTRTTLEVWARSRENLLVGNCSVFGFLGNVTYGLFGLAEEGVAPGPETDAVTSCLSGLQKPDGSWEGGDTRPPLAGRNPFVYTALAVRGLTVYSSPGRREETAARVARAREFLRRGVPADTQEEVFKLLGLVWAGGAGRESSAQVRRLIALQHTDGGWSQLPTMRPDAYASGQALYALGVAGEAASSDAYRRGVQYLLRTQLEDGSWYVQSRAIGFQPYFDAGFPHGRDQFISTAATSWAVTALSDAL